MTIRLLQQFPPKSIDAVPYVGGITYGFRTARTAARKLLRGEEFDVGSGNFPVTREFAKYVAL